MAKPITSFVRHYILTALLMAILLITFGVAAPFLISAKSTGAVVAGIVLAAVTPPAAIAIFAAFRKPKLKTKRNSK